MNEPRGVATTYDVLLYANLDTRLGLERRWLIAGSHASRASASAQFRELEEEFPSNLMNIVIVASVHDATTGRFRDRIVKSRETAPLIDRGKLRKLTPEEMPKLAAAVAAVARPRAKATVPAPPRQGTPIWIWAAALVLAAGGTGLALAALAP